MAAYTLTEKQKKLCSIATRKAIQARKDRGEKYCRWTEYGYAWERYYDPALNKDINIKVAHNGERAIMAKCVELRAAGCSYDKIRQHLNYELKARTRMGGHWTGTSVTRLVSQWAIVNERREETFECPRCHGCRTVLVDGGSLLTPPPARARWFHNQECYRKWHLAQEQGSQQELLQRLRKLEKLTGSILQNSANPDVLHTLKKEFEQLRTSQE